MELTKSANPLHAYRVANGLTFAALGTMIGATAGETQKYTLPLDDPDFRIPRPKRMRRIAAMTGITADGFYGLAAAHVNGAAGGRGNGAGSSPAARAPASLKKQRRSPEVSRQASKKAARTRARQREARQ